MRKAWPDGEKDKTVGRGWLPWAVGFTLLLIMAILGALFYLLAPPRWDGPPLVSQGVDALQPGVISMQPPLDRPYLGVTYQEVSAQVKDHADGTAAGSLLVTSIAPGSPAAMAGLATGDVIMAVDGQPLSRENPLIKLLLNRRVGDRVKLLVQRGQDHLNIEVVLGKK